MRSELDDQLRELSIARSKAATGVLDNILVQRVERLQGIYNLLDNAHVDRHKVRAERVHNAREFRKSLAAEVDEILTTGFAY